MGEIAFHKSSIE